MRVHAGVRSRVCLAVLSGVALMACTDDVRPSAPTTTRSPSPTVDAGLTPPTDAGPDIVDRPALTTPIHPFEEWPGGPGLPSTPATGWERLPDPHLLARTDPVVVSGDDALVVFGGNRARVPDGALTSDAEPLRLTDGAVYTPSTGTWRLIPAMGYVPGWELLYDVFVWDHALYVLQGMELFSYALPSGPWVHVEYLGPPGDYTLDDVHLGGKLIVYDVFDGTDRPSFGGVSLDLPLGRVESFSLPDGGGIHRGLVVVGDDLYSFADRFGFDARDPDPILVVVFRRHGADGPWVALGGVRVRARGPWIASGTLVFGVATGDVEERGDRVPAGAVLDTTTGEWYRLPPSFGTDPPTTSTAAFDATSATYDGASPFALDIVGRRWVRVPPLPASTAPIVGGTLGPDLVAFVTAGDVDPEIENQLYVWRTHT